LYVVCASFEFCEGLTEEDLRPVERIANQYGASAYISLPLMMVIVSSSQLGHDIALLILEISPAARVVICTHCERTLSATVALVQSVLQRLPWNHLTFLNDAHIGVSTDDTRFRIVDIGKHRLGSLHGPIQTSVLLERATASSDSARSLSLDLVDHNLPIYRDRFIGRSIEVEEFLSLLGNSRVITFEGTGGIGKTRLACECALYLAQKEYETIRYVSLSHVAPSAEVNADFLRQIGFTFEDVGGLRQVYGDKRVAIVLDNCEHVIDSVHTLVTHLTRILPWVSIICTSRKAIRHHDERLIHVGPLSLPEESASGEQLRGFGAVQLFIDRLESHSVVEPDNLSSIARICHLVEGIPLAIEHAAEQAARSSLDQTEKSLSKTLLQLRSDRVSRPSHHHTMRATLAWSIDLLSEGERTALGAASVVPGDFFEEDLLRVLRHEITETEFTSLVEHNLLLSKGISQHGCLYSVYDVLREFCRESEIGSLRREDVWDRWLDYLSACECDRASQWHEESVAKRYAAIAAVAREGILRRDIRSIAILESLLPFWANHGPFKEALALLVYAQECGLQLSIRLLAAKGTLAWLAGDCLVAADYYTVAKRAATSACDHQTLVRIQINEASMYASNGELDQALSLLDEARLISLKYQLTHSLTLACGNSIRLFLEKGHPRLALDYFSKHESMLREFEHAYLQAKISVSDAYASLSEYRSMSNTLIDILLASQESDASEIVCSALTRAIWLLRDSDPEAAAILSGQVLDLFVVYPQGSAARKSYMEESMGRLQEVLQPSSLAYLQSKGRVTPLSGVCQLALQSLHAYTSGCPES